LLLRSAEIKLLLSDLSRCSTVLGTDIFR